MERTNYCTACMLKDIINIIQNSLEVWIRRLEIISVLLLGSKKSEPNIKERLLDNWSNQLSSVGENKREPKKLADKLKKDMQLARGLLSTYVRNLAPFH